MEFCKELVLHYTPGHVGLIGNELANDKAQYAAKTFTPAQQDDCYASLSNLKSHLRHQLFDTFDWSSLSNSELEPGLRSTLMQNKTSRLKLRLTSPRPFQTLFSRYRCNRVESAGEYPRKLGYIIDTSCRLCGHPQETILHLLVDCVGTSAYRSEHNISINTLATESSSSMLKVAEFDAWIRKTVHYDTQPPSYRIQATLDLLEKRRKRKCDENENEFDVRWPSKRNCLVIPDHSLENTRATKIRRIE